MCEIVLLFKNNINPTTIKNKTIDMFIMCEIVLLFVACQAFDATQF